MNGLSDATPESVAFTAGRKRWGSTWSPTMVSTAPGRIELLGNHVDYNGGPVLAAAIDRYAAALIDASPLTHGGIEFEFVDTEHVCELHSEDLAEWRNATSEQIPVDYARGAIAALISNGYEVRSARISISSSVPIGIGVSSSAALCIAMVQAMSPDALNQKDLILIAQEAEHRAGTPCGTMDQSASVAGGVIRFNGATLDFERLTPQLDYMAFLVVDSGIKRSLAHSAYPVRVSECREAIGLLQHSCNRQVTQLADVTMSDLEMCKDAPLSPYQLTLMKRVQHVAEECERVRQGQKALEHHKWDGFGALMTASGRSSATLYDISHTVVEELVSTLLTDPAVVGARMMGGGEGGSLIALVRNGTDDSVRNRLSELVNASRTEASVRREIFPFSFASGASIQAWIQ